MALVPIPFRRQLPSGQLDPAFPAVFQAGQPAAGTSTVVSGTAVPSGSVVPQKASKVPSRWAVGLVALVLILASALVGLGHPVSIVMEVLACGGYLGVELVRLLNREM